MWATLLRTIESEKLQRLYPKRFLGCPLTMGTDDKDNRSYRVSFEKIKSILPAFKCQRDASTGAAQFENCLKESRCRLSCFSFGPLLG